MTISTLRWKRIGSHEYPLPTRATAGSAGYDLYWAGINAQRFHLYPNETQMLPTGWAVEIPDGFVGLIRERSGAAKTGLTVKGGVIDSDFVGQIQIILSAGSDGGETMIVPGKAFAQMIVVPCLMLDSVEVVSLKETARGGRGFGSTGG